MLKSLITTKSSNLLIVLSAILIISACKKGGDDFSDLAVGGDGDSIPCELTGTVPDANSLKVAATSGTINQFITQTSSSTCAIKYVLNGTEITNTNGIAEIDSANFRPGTNTLKVTVTNKAGSASKEWTVTKNNAPACASQVPSNLSPNVAAGTDLSMTVNGSDSDNDPLQFAWKYNGSANATLLVPTINSSSASQVSFRPQAENGGIQAVRVDISDGYDTVSCSWNVSITGDCSLTSHSPSSNTLRILSTGSTQSTFQVSTATNGCQVNWTLNGSPLSGTESLKLLTSSQFATGNNVLMAAVTGAAGTSQQIWTVVKNSVPACGTMNPLNTSSQTAGIGQNVNLSLTATDSNSDPLTFAWKLNSQTVGSTILATSSTGMTASGVFTPDATHVGANSVTVDVNDGYETTTCSWPVSVIPSCDIASSSPAHATAQRIASQSVQSRAFNVTPNYPAYCSVEWFLNGVSVGTGSLYNLASTNSGLSSGSNHTLMAKVSNGSGSEVTRTWNITKNSVPVCATLSPASTTLSMTQGATQNFTGTLTDADNDTLSFAWRLNGSTSAALATLGNLTLSSTSSFTPAIGNVGSNIIALNVDDGYDTVTCSWNVAVNGNCTLTGNSPSNVSPIKISDNGFAYLYTINTSTTGCPVNWTINGFPVTGTESFKSFNSSDFSPGNNNLVASVSNGVTTDTVTWNIRRNVLPTSVQTPSNSGTTNLSINDVLNFNANVTDIDGDTLTASWKVDGQTVSTSILNPTSASNPFVAAFSPTNSYTGSRLISAFISDGTDTVEFTWNAMVYNNCTVASSFPSATQRVSVQNNVTTTYGVIPNDSNCLVTWKLNGSTVGTGNLFNLASLNGSLGSTNELKAILDNGVGDPAEQTWTIVKNTPPSCLAGQTPNATGNELFYTSTMNFSCESTDNEGDTLSYSWKLNNAYPELFDNILSSANQTSARLNPSIGVLGVGQVITANFTDGWDTGFCQWNVNIKDPAQVQIQACSPTQGATTLMSKVSETPVKYDIKTFTVSATGPGINYRWKEDGVELSGETSAQLKVSTSMTDTSTGETPDYIWATGTRDLVVEVVDQYNNVQSCTWSLKRNRPPFVNTSQAGTNSTGATATLDSTLLSTTGKIRMNYASTLELRLYGSDLDTDDSPNLTYYWKVNNQQIDSGGNDFITYTTAGDKSYSTATITPDFDTYYLGPQTITAVVSDGSETATYTWTLEVNMFSNECNTLYNASNRGGQVCTLVGQAGVGADRAPLDDQTKMRLQPYNVAFDGNNIIFTDWNSNSIFYWNRGTSAGDNVTRFGISIPYGQIKAVLGMGAAGTTPNKNTISDDFKLYNPRDVVYYGGRLYVADMSNHRVVVLKEDGIAESFLGRISNNALPSNVTAANSSNGTQSGTTQYCYNPKAMTLVTEGVNIFLYVGCTYSIKKVNITNPADVANYGKASLVVGRILTSTGAASDGFENGDPLTEARTTRPQAMATDNAGNVYWTEGEGRLRVLNRSGSTLSFFNGRYISDRRTLYINSLDNNNTPTGANVTTVLGAVRSSVKTATKFVFYGPANGRQNQCLPYVAQMLDGNNDAAVSGSNITATLAVTNGALYTDSGCTSALAANQVTINAGGNFAEFYVKVNGAAGTNSSLTMSNGGGLTAATAFTITNAAGATTTLAKFLIAAPISMDFNDCRRVYVSAADSSNRPLTDITAGTIGRIFLDNGGNFYASDDPTCAGTPVNTVSYTGGTNNYQQGYLYYARTTKIPTGKVGTLFGIPAATGGTTTGDQNSNVQNYTGKTNGGSISIGQATFRLGQGLDVHYDGSNILGFFIGNYNHHRISYVNNNDSSGTTTGTQSIGGQTFGSNAVSTGLYHEHATVIGVVNGTNASSTAGYNGDNKTGINTRTNAPYSFKLDPNQNYLYYGDLSNWRLRKLKVSSGSGQNMITTDIGIGRSRAGWYGDALVPADDATFNQPTDILFDSTDKSLLISDMVNGRIRRVDLQKGSFETIAGRGRGDSTVPSEDRFGMLLGGPVQMALYKPSGKNVLLFADNSVTGAPLSTGWAGQPQFPGYACNVRALNRSASTTTTIFGEEVLAGAISTIVGEYNYGCDQTVISNLGSSGQQTSLQNPFGLVTDNTNMYLSDMNQHCIIKIDANNTLSSFAGQCGTTGYNDGISDGINASNITRFNYPTQMLMDPSYPQNFFVLDNYTGSIGYVRYVNTTASNVPFPAVAGGQALGKGSGVSRVTTIWNLAPTGTTSRLNGIATYKDATKDKVCISSGGSGSGFTQAWIWSDVGAHGVYCFDRDDASGTAVRIVGSNFSTATRGGSSTGFEHELKAGTSVLLYQPHGLAFDADGNLYIAERGAHVIRMVRKWW